MGLLCDKFYNLIHKIGMNDLKHPIFNYSSIGIRFEIGGNDDVYIIDELSKRNIANPSYISAAFERAKSIYANLPNKPNILRIDVYTEDGVAKKEIQIICKVGNLPMPQEHYIKPFKWEEDDEMVYQHQLYWDLEKIAFNPNKILKEIIKADIGGNNQFASNIYFVDTRNLILFNLYDDRGADLVASDRETLRSIYEKFHSWILEQK